MKQDKPEKFAKKGEAVKPLNRRQKQKVSDLVKKLRVSIPFIMTLMCSLTTTS